MKQKTGRKLLSFLLTLAMVVGLMPGMGLTAYADDDPPYAQYKNTTTVITFDGKSWYLIDYDASTVTLLAKECVASSKYDKSAKFVEYSSSPTVKTAVDNWYTGNITADAKAAVSGNAMFLLTKGEANAITDADVRKCTNAPNGGWWLCSQGRDSYTAAFVDGGSGAVNANGKDTEASLGVRPALKLNLSSVTFDSESKTFTVGSAKETQTITAADVTATFGDTGKSVSGTTTGDGAISYSVKSGDAVTVDENTGALTIVKAGSAVITVTAAETDTYAQATKDVTVTVNTKAMTVSAEDVNVTVDGQPHGITVNVTDPASGATVKYGTEEGSYTLDTSPTQTEVGEKTVYYQVTADNYTTYTGSAKVTVNAKQTQTITAADVTATYGDTGKSVSGTTTGDGAISYSVKSGDAVTVNPTTGALTIVKAGSAVITVTAAETATYAQATKDVNVTVNTKAMTVSAEDVNVTVDGQPHGITVNVTDPASGATVKYGTEVGTYNLDASPTQTEAGELTVYYQVTADNYTTYTGSAKVTVNAKSAQTITASDVTATYGDTGKSVSGTTTGDGAISYAIKTGSEDYIGVDATTGALTIKKVGTAIVVVTAAETDTYAKATKEVTVTINKGEGGGTPSANTLVYNGSAQELVTAGVAEGGTMMYALGENASTAPEETAFTASIPTGVDAKTYYVWYMVKGDANHNDTKPACVEATIAKKGLTVTADAKSKTQGEADPALTYTAEGLVGSDTLTGALSREAGEDPGTYAITQGTLTAGDNYEITFTSAVLTINKKDEPAPAPSGGGGGYYGGGTVQNQRRDAYSDVIGAAATSFRDSSPERIRNIELACEKLDGIVLQPGEVFSFNEAVGGLTAEAGFAVAPVNPDDETTAEMGGGVSQVASALYSSSLFALLETVERTNHPFAVPFIQPGTDAYVTDPGNADALDLKFRNTRGEPIRISAKTRVDEARQVREIVIELRSALGSSDYMPIRFDNTWGGDQNAFLTETPYDLTRPGYRILLTHEEQQFTDASGAGIRTLTHRKILDAAGMLVRDEILNSKLPDGSYAMDTYYQG